MNGLRISPPEGRAPFTVPEISVARGRALLAERLAELRQVCPSLRVVDDFENALPIMVVEVTSHGGPMDVLIDPLGLLERCGYTPELPERLRNLDGESWLEI